MQASVKLKTYVYKERWVDWKYMSTHKECTYTVNRIESELSKPQQQYGYRVSRSLGRKFERVPLLSYPYNCCLQSMWMSNLIDFVAATVVSVCACTIWNDLQSLKGIIHIKQVSHARLGVGVGLMGMRMDHIQDSPHTPINPLVCTQILYAGGISQAIVLPTHWCSPLKKIRYVCWACTYVCTCTHTSS